MSFPPPSVVQESPATSTKIKPGKGWYWLEPMEIEEDAYIELVEFLRVGVQLVYDELRTERRPGPTTRH